MSIRIVRKLSRNPRQDTNGKSEDGPNELHPFESIREVIVAYFIDPLLVRRSCVVVIASFKKLAEVAQFNVAHVVDVVFIGVINVTVHFVVGEQV